MACLVGIDNGLTVTKAVVFDEDGAPLAVARREVPQLMPAARRVERDMDVLWQQTAAATREAIAQCGRPASDIAAVAATAHGDGVYVLDKTGRPLGTGILSLDSRAGDIVADWTSGDVAERALHLTGQMPHVSAPSALLAWMKAVEPERFAAIAHVLACKDWLRYCLTGAIGADRTEASTSFTDVRTQDYSAEAMTLFGLEALTDALPPVSHSAEIVGTVTAEAAALTGLMEGTPVAAGLHDVTASALGIGGHREGTVGIVAGTYSINEIVSRAPKIDPRWFCRNAVAPGFWNNMSISPSSTANYDWFLSTFCDAERAEAQRDGTSIHARLAPEIRAALERPSSILYQPFLFGSPYGELASGSFLGLRGWHKRGDVLAALLEGIAFNHRHHVDALREGFPASSAHLTGGASRNPTVAQLFADIMGLPVRVTETEEAAAWGAALCAGAAVGMFDSFDADPRDLDAITTTYLPDEARRAHYDQRYATYREIADGFASSWKKLDDLEKLGRGATA
ncbi:FGGY-family carbohydrate kinase [Tropicimonas isoalkanivorans]|uniref:L-xylulokinase n=1 Tax=Tropicimonas isoalkanivorans TaxID=441112 RepID=A0A1I1IWZ8_9RHOB|nr:FGGY-family carbohydrate kinase [Tropicimonas isoalkanivorans]SFC40705.1 L-xylulokinase [Tropicimonas isoalkanivorans]